MQVSETNLIVGADIAKVNHVARGQDIRGIEWVKAGFKPTRSIDLYRGMLFILFYFILFYFTTLVPENSRLIPHLKSLLLDPVPKPSLD